MTEVRSAFYTVLDQQCISIAEFQKLYDYTGRTFTLLEDSDRARCHSWFHKIVAGLVELPEGNPIQQGWPTNKVNERTLTLKPEPVNGYEKSLTGHWTARYIDSAKRSGFE